MNPLSIFIYYSRNKRKALPVLGILALAVFGISLSLVLTSTIFSSVREFVSPYYKFIVVQPNFNKKITEINPASRGEIRRNSHLALALPVQTMYMYGVVLGITQNYPIFGVDETQMSTLLQIAGSQVVAGRLPTARANEVALYESIVKSRGLHVGSEIGRDVNSDDSLGGKWTVVGIISGDTAINLAALDRVTQGRPAVAMLLVPKPNEMSGLSADLDAINNQGMVIKRLPIGIALSSAYWDNMIRSSALLILSSLPCYPSASACSI